MLRQWNTHSRLKIWYWNRRLKNRLLTIKRDNLIFETIDVMTGCLGGMFSDNRFRNDLLLRGMESGRIAVYLINSESCMSSGDPLVAVRYVRPCYADHPIFIKLFPNIKQEWAYKSCQKEIDEYKN